MTVFSGFYPSERAAPIARYFPLYINFFQYYFLFFLCIDQALYIYARNLQVLRLKKIISFPEICTLYAICTLQVRSGVELKSVP
jgi:hypothetical protein